MATNKYGIEPESYADLETNHPDLDKNTSSGQSPKNPFDGGGSGDSGYEKKKTKIYFVPEQTVEATLNPDAPDPSRVYIYDCEIDMDNIPEYPRSLTFIFDGRVCDVDSDGSVYDSEKYLFRLSPLGLVDVSAGNVSLGEHTVSSYWVNEQVIVDEDFNDAVDACFPKKTIDDVGKVISIASSFAKDDTAPIAEKQTVTVQEGADFPPYAELNVADYYAFCQEGIVVFFEVNGRVSQTKVVYENNFYYCEYYEDDLAVFAIETEQGSGGLTFHSYYAEPGEEYEVSLYLAKETDPVWSLTKVTSLPEIKPSDAPGKVLTLVRNDHDIVGPKWEDLSVYLTDRYDSNRIYVVYRYVLLFKALAFIEFSNSPIEKIAAESSFSFAPSSVVYIPLYAANSANDGAYVAYVKIAKDKTMSVTKIDATYAGSVYGSAVFALDQSQFNWED